MITTEFNQKSGILTVSLFDDVSFQNILDYLYKLKQVKNMPEDLRLLYDTRSARVMIDKEQLKIVSDIAIETFSSYKSVRSAFVVKNAIEQGYSKLFVGFATNDKPERNTFNSIEEALQWLSA